MNNQHGMSPLAAALAAKIQAAMPEASVQVHDPDGAHLSAVVVWAKFATMSRVAQHKMVYAALGDAFDRELHALQLTTRAV